MRYEVPPDTRQKEAIVGGIFTASQMIFMAVGFIAGALLAMSLFATFNSIVAAGIGLVLGWGPFLPFAFVRISKMGNMELFQYLLIKRKYNKGQKYWLNYNENYEGERKKADPIPPHKEKYVSNKKVRKSISMSDLLNGDI